MSYEIELIALAVLLYLYDCALLLYSNEGVLVRIGKEHWRVGTGSETIGIAGRQLYLLNPLTPYRASYRLSWDYLTLNPNPTSVHEWSERAAEFAALAPLAPIAGLALFVLLPVGLFTGAGSFAVIPALVAVYGSIVVALVIVYRRRDRLQLPRRRVFAIAFECLACPPLAVNMVRRITLAETVTESLPMAGVRLLSVERWQRLCEQCIHRLDEAIAQLPPDSSEMPVFERQKQRLRGLV